MTNSTMSSGAMTLPPVRARAVEELDGLSAFDDEFYVFDILSHGEFHGDEFLDGRRGGKFVESVLGEGIEGDGTEETCLDALCAQDVHRALRDPRHGAVSGDDHLGVLGEIVLEHGLVGAHIVIHLLQLVVHVLKLIGDDVEGVDDAAGLAEAFARGRPGLLGEGGGILHLGQRDRLHDLPQHTVAEDHDGQAVSLRLVERIIHKVDALLHGAGAVHQHLIVAVTAALHRLEIVSLRGLDAAETGTRAHHVDDDAGKLRAADVGDALLLQADAGARGAGHRSAARTRGTVHHVDGCDLALRLDEVSADLRQTPAHIFRDLVLRGDGIAGIETAAAADGGFCDCFVTFHQFSFCHNYFSTVITQSGHIVAQKAQAMHCSGAISSTTK